MFPSKMDHGPRYRALLISFLILSSSAMVLPNDRVTGQTLVVIDLEIVQDFVNISAPEDGSVNVTMDGWVRVTKPPSALVVVDVYLYAEGPSEFSTFVEPEVLEFVDPGEDTFVLTIVVQAGIENITNATFRVTGNAVSAGYKTDTDYDSVSLLIEYLEDPPPEPPDVRPDDLDLGTHPAVFFGFSLMVGAVVGYLLYLKRKRAKDATWRRQRERRDRERARRKETFEPVEVIEEDGPRGP